MSSPTIPAAALPWTDRPAWRTTWRYRWILLWAAAVVAFTVTVGFPGSHAQIFTVVGLGLIASGTTSESGTGWRRVVVDWFPFYALLAIYDMLRGSAKNWFTPHVIPQVRVDEWIFGGTVPTVTLQHALYTPGVAHVWDYAAFAVYMTHFVVPFAVAGLLWKFAYDRFRRFATLLVMLTFATLTTYALYPAVPPWLASQNGDLQPTGKVIDEMWTHIRISNGSGLFSGNGNFANPVAAVPSLHAAYPMLLLLFFWGIVGRWRWLLLLYPIAMAVTLVYTGEHFVVDIILGWLYAVVTFVVGNWLFDRYEARRARSAVGVGLGAVGQDGSAQLGARQLRRRHTRAGEVGGGEIHVGEIGTPQVGASKVGVAQGGAGQARPHEASTEHGGATEVGPREIDVVEVGVIELGVEQP